MFEDLIVKNTKMSGREFYFRSFTWGLPVNVGGALIAAVLLSAGVEPHRFGRCIQFDIGKNWGGGSLGVFMFTCRNASKRLKEHEHGHGLQNCYYGPFMPLLVNVPSSLRFWYRKAVQRLVPEKKLPPYDSIWFEAEATRIGKEYIENMENEFRNGITSDEVKKIEEDEICDYPVLRTASRVLLGALAAVLAAETIAFKKNKK
ncbi:MAG: hypothetical protein Q4F31_02240 [Eubacteriales bacterium]|nr:hypothetical protein [Eubacteriales bacterium]